MNTEALAMKAATILVEHWEAIPSKARVIRFALGGDQEFEDVTIKLMRENAGGEDLYLEAKRFLETRS